MGKLTEEQIVEKRYVGKTCCNDPYFDKEKNKITTRKRAHKSLKKIHFLPHSNHVVLEFEDTNEIMSKRQYALFIAKYRKIYS